MSDQDNNHTAKESEDVQDSLELGSTGERVRLLQNMLSTLGYYSGPVDGNYGPETVRAVRQFQIVWGLISDGICGRETQDVISSRFSNEFRETVRETPVDGYIPIPRTGMYRRPGTEVCPDTPFDGERTIGETDSDELLPLWKRWLVKEK